MAYRTESDVHGERYGDEAGRRNHAYPAHWVGGRATRPLVTPVDTDDAVHADDAISIDEVIERLSRDMEAAVHRAADGERDELHEYEVGLIREQSVTASTYSRSPVRRARVTFFSIALWLAAAGVLFTFLLPPAAIACLVMAGIAGILAAVLGPDAEQPERYRDRGDIEPHT